MDLKAVAPALTRLHTLLEERTEERMIQVDNSIDAAAHASQGCPFCEVLEHSDHGVYCLSCRGFLSEALLKALCRISDLPAILPTSSPGTSARGAGMGRSDASSSLSGSRPRASVPNADHRLYGVA
jgi:hypothetical protein